MWAAGIDTDIQYTAEAAVGGGFARDQAVFVMVYNVHCILYSICDSVSLCMCAWEWSERENR